MSKIFGYCRISTPKQKLEHQVQNILKEYPNAIIVQETFSGTKSIRCAGNLINSYVTSG